MRLGPSIMRLHVSNASPSWRPWKAEARIRVSRASTDWLWSPSTTAIGSRTRDGSSYLARWDMGSPLRVEPRARLGVLALALGALEPVPTPPGDQRLLDGAAGEACLELGDDAVAVEEAAREDVEVRALFVGEDVEAHVALRDHRHRGEDWAPVGAVADDVGAHDRRHADRARQPVEEREERVQALRPMVGVDVE